MEIEHMDVHGLDKIHLLVITPSEELYNEEVDSVTFSLPEGEGEREVLAGHINYVSPISNDSYIVARCGEKFMYFSMEEGIVEVFSSGRYIEFLVAQAKMSTESVVDARRSILEEKLSRAAKQAKSEEELLQAEIDLKKAINQLKISQTIGR